MLCRLANPIARALAAVTFPSSIALVSLSSAAALAQGADATAPAQENGAGQADFDPLAERIAYLHARLRITPAQEPLWANLAQVMRENAKSVAPLIRERLRNAQTGSAIAALGTYEKLGQAQLDGLKKFAAAFQALYDTLSDQQKKIADSLFRLSRLSMAGGIPALPQQLVAPAPYVYSPPYPIPPAYPPSPNVSPYSYFPSYGPLVVGPPIGLGAPFFIFARRPHRQPAVLPVRPPVRVFVPRGGPPAMNEPFRRQ